jgi:hypothetical protein
MLQIVTNVMNIDTFTAIFGLLIALGGDIGVWVDVVRRETSIDRIATRGPGVRKSHVLNDG